MRTAEGRPARAGPQYHMYQMIAALSSHLSCLDYVLKLQKRRIRGDSICATSAFGEHVEEIVADDRAQDLREGVVHIHDLGLRDRCDDLAQCRVHGLVVSSGCPH